MNRPVGSGQRRPWLTEARLNHELTREEAEFLVAKRRGRRISNDQREREIEARRLRRGLSQPDLSLLINCSQNEISKIETGERDRMNPGYIESIAKVLRMSREEVMYGSPQPRIFWILGEMQGDEAIRIYPERERLQISDLMPGANTIGYKVAVSTLQPRFRLGDVLLCPQDPAPLEACAGRECVVEIEGKRYVGLVEQGASPRVITLRPSSRANPMLIDKTPTWISPIIATYHTPPLGCPVPKTY